ncbi:hypothetical protein [Mycolicibacterium diernhoferi]|uniref:hypothetical protein n=1 Tax=Mycolicibacterium diernhoferi TaxID=1801 RepID=UPI001041EA71|nr:hypothetical protein [Mycolicibacterium diernhoferi]QYL23801.1 hypothetical protein K0O62_05740 [Mycolicibacterium diernhoferi]
MTIWTFLPGEQAVSAADLQQAKESVLSCAPAGSRVQARGIDEHFMLFDVAVDPSRPTFGDELGNDHPARIAVTIWLPDGIEDPEVRAMETLDRLHGQDPAPLASAVCDSQFHLDITEVTGEPSAHVVILLTKAAHTSRDEAIWHYRSHHVPMAKSLQPFYTRYSTHRALHVRGDFPEDGITVQEFPSRDAMTRHIQKRFEPDDDSFQDLANFLSKVDFYTGEHFVL